MKSRKLTTLAGIALALPILESQTKETASSFLPYLCQIALVNYQITILHQMCGKPFPHPSRIWKGEIQNSVKLVVCNLDQTCQTHTTHSTIAIYQTYQVKSHCKR